MTGLTKECPACEGEGWHEGDLPCDPCDTTGRVPITESELEAAGQLNALTTPNGR